MSAGGTAAGEPLAPDPFEAFNRRQGLGVVRDPHRFWRELRRKAPVHRLTVRELTGRDAPGGLLGSEVYVAFSFDAVVDVLRDPETFSSAFYGRTLGLVLGRTILELDEPEHFRHRALLQRAFTHGALRRWEERVIAPAVRSCLAPLRGRGRADLVRDVTFPFPVRVIAEMIGVPEESHADFHRLAVELISVSFDPARGIAASRALREMFLTLLDDRRARPADDLVSVLAHAEVGGERLDDEAIVSFLRLLAPAGAETTYRSTSSLLLALLRHPEQLAALRDRRSLIPRAIEEGLRWECPVTFILRSARRDVTFYGVRIPEGATVGVNLAAANRDEGRWPDPDRFDLFRPPRAHVAFAVGPHTCLGKHLARLESRVLLEMLLEELPGLRLDPSAGDAHVTGLTFRSPLALPVVWDA